MIRKFKNIILIISFIIILILLYGYIIEPNLFITKEYTIKDPNLPDSFDGVKIVHFSDLHYGRNIKIKNIDKIVNEINFIKPDIVVFTGDLIEYPNKLTTNDLNVLTKSLKNIKAKIGKYAILGNHDYDFDKEKVKNILVNSNFQVLQNSKETLYNNNKEKIMLYGLDDVLKKEADLNKTFEIKEEEYKIVLVHEPDYIDHILKEDSTINLILAGHSHDGQIKIPFLQKFYKLEGATKYYANYYQKNNTNIYISSGIGVSQVTFRLFNLPSINFYRINKED